MGQDIEDAGQVDALVGRIAQRDRTLIFTVLEAVFEQQIGSGAVDQDHTFRQAFRGAVLIRAVLFEIGVQVTQFAKREAEQQVLRLAKVAQERPDTSLVIAAVTELRGHRQVILENNLGILFAFVKLTGQGACSEQQQVRLDERAQLCLIQQAAFDQEGPDLAV